MHFYVSESRGKKIHRIRTLALRGAEHAEKQKVPLGVN